MASNDPISTRDPPPVFLMCFGYYFLVYQGQQEALTALEGQFRQVEDELFYVVTSPLYPSTVFRYDAKARTSAPFEAAMASTSTSRIEVGIGVPSKYFTLPVDVSASATAVTLNRASLSAPQIR